jgi:oligosaccharide repeat unit polymerase
MNISFKSLFKEISLFIIAGFLLIHRYINIDIEHSQVTLFSLYYVFAVMTYVFSRLRFKSLINPISIFVPFLFLLSYSFLQLSENQNSYSLTTFLVINVSITTYLVFASLEYSYKPLIIIRADNNLRVRLVRFISFMAFITFVIECFMFGYIPIFNITSLDVYNDSNSKLVPFLHYFIIINAFLPSWLYIFFKENLISKREFRVLLFVSCFILLNYLSKQMYLLFGLTFFMSYSFYNALRLKGLFKAAGAVSIVFLFLGYLRIDPKSSLSAAELYRTYAGIQNEEVSMIESFFVLYSSVRFTVLNEMINFSDKIHYLGSGIYTFRPITSLFLLEKIDVIQRIPELDSESRVGTFLADPYLDFGFLGVLFLNAFYGFMALRYYRQYKDKYPEAIVKFSIIVFCILMGMFVNYFNTMLIWLGILFNKFIIGGLVKKSNL